MIDYVHLKECIFIPEEYFKIDLWKKGSLHDGAAVYYHRKRGCCIYYYPDNYRITVRGKLMMLLEDSEVLNPDDIYGLDISQFIEDINAYLNGLFIEPLLDISVFHVLRIDYCFNVSTPYVKEYIDFMNKAFSMAGNGSRINYVHEKGLDGSIYVKTKSDYTKNQRRNYVLNFYNKSDRLRCQRSRNHRVAQNDFKYAQDMVCSMPSLTSLKTSRLHPILLQKLQKRLQRLC